MSFSPRTIRCSPIVEATALGVHKKRAKFLLAMQLVVFSIRLADLPTDFIKQVVGRVCPLNSMALPYHHEDGKRQRRPADFKQTEKRGNYFPSAHASNSMAFVVMLMLILKKTKPWMLLIPLSVGYSRIHLGKHFPTDVMAGWIVGPCVCFATWLLWEYLIKEKIPPQYRI